MIEGISIQRVLVFFEKMSLIVVNSPRDPSLIITGPRSIQRAKPSQLTLITKKYASECVDLARTTESQIILIDQALFSEKKDKLPNDKVFVLSENPKKDLISFSKQLLKNENKTTVSSIDPSASIAEEVELGKSIFIGSNVCIESNVRIGERCVIGSNSVIKSGTVIGHDVVIGSCAVIGGDGFGYTNDSPGSEYEQFPHFGGVIIKDRVHIGNNTCIDRGSLDDTIIENGVKIDNLVHIAHNVKIGKNSLIIAKSMIAGSVQIGSDCWLAPSCNILNGLKIGNKVFVGLASTVTRDLKDNEKVMGSPAVSLEEFKKSRDILKKQLE